MRDITDLMNAYRECCRNLFNVYFSKKENIGVALDRFGEIERLLFDALITDELTYDESYEVDNAPASDLRVVPDARTPILIERPGAPGEATLWDKVQDLFVGPGDIELAFIEYFERSKVPIREFDYYLCKILRFPRHTRYEGRRALIEVLHARVFDNEP